MFQALEAEVAKSREWQLNKLLTFCLTFDALCGLMLSDGSAVGPSNLGNVISQLLLCKQINPDFHSEGKHIELARS